MVQMSEIDTFLEVVENLPKGPFFLARIENKFNLHKNLKSPNDYTAYPI